MGKFSPYKYHEATGSGAIADTFDPDGNVVIVRIRVHFDAVGGAPANNDLTIDLNANAGAAHDVNLFTQDMQTVKDVIIQEPGDGAPYTKGDQILTAYANPNAVTWGIQIVYREEE